MNEQVMSSLDELEGYAHKVLQHLVARPRSGAAVIALSGELGAGKTAFVKALAKLLGVTEHVTSPTFVIMKTYDLEEKGRKDERMEHGFKTLTHIDAYRLENAHELEVLGWKELLADPQALVAVEWPEKTPGIMPHDAVYLTFDTVNDTTRTIRSSF